MNYKNSTRFELLLELTKVNQLEFTTHKLIKPEHRFDRLPTTLFTALILLCNFQSLANMSFQSWQKKFKTS